MKNNTWWRRCAAVAGWIVSAAFSPDDGARAGLPPDMQRGVGLNTPWLR